jgi:hypothetical protein
MLKLVALLLFAGLAGIDARAEDPSPPPANPRTYALVAVFPDQFHVAYETPPSERPAGFSNRVDQYRRTTLEAPSGTFNRVALAGLEKVIARRDPGARFVFLAKPGETPRGIAGVDREEFRLRRVREELQGLPQRSGWHRIVVVLPAYRVLDLDGMATRLEGFGLVMQPNCQSDPGSCGLAFRPKGSGATVRTPEGEEARASFFVAPYSYVSIVILDPGTLEVLEREHILDHQKLFDPQSGTLDLAQNIPKDVLAGQVVHVIERSVASAIDRTELAGKVEIREVREVKPGP